MAETKLKNALNILQDIFECLLFIVYKRLFVEKRSKF